jgi:hypothetical protein
MQTEEVTQGTDHALYFLSFSYDVQPYFFNLICCDGTFWIYLDNR